MCFLVEAFVIVVLGFYTIIPYSAALTLKHIEDSPSTRKNSGFHYATFNKGVICHAAMSPVQPTSLADIQATVHLALERNLTLKPIGGKFSGTDIICTDGLPVDMQAINHLEFDPRTGFARVGAGTRLGVFLEFLHKNGRTVHGIPTYEDITVGGAIGTGSHGTSLNNSATISDQAVSFVIVDGLGGIRNISTPEELRAFRAHLGLLGIVYEVTVKTISQYKLHIRNYEIADDVLWKDNKILEKASSYDRFQFFWFPGNQRVVISEGSRVPVNTSGNCHTRFLPEVPRFQTWAMSNILEGTQTSGNNLGYAALQTFMKNSLFRRVFFKSPIFTADDLSMCMPAIGYSHKMCSNRCINCPWNHGKASVFQFEYAAIIPLTELQPAINSIRDILREHPMEFPMTGIYFRFLSASNGLLTPNSGRASVAVEWVAVPRHDRFSKPTMGLATYQAMIQALMFIHQGRPHWGKNGPVYTHQQFLLKRYPNMSTFVKLMKEFDPRGIFLNDFGRRLVFGSTKSSLDSYIKHCAIPDACICHKDEDCGKGTHGLGRCGSIKEYRVCQYDLR